MGDLPTEAALDAPRATVLARELLRRYPGEFLADETERPWILHRRERLRREFQRTLAMLGRVLQRDGGMWEEAADLYCGGIERDPLAEMLYQEAMRCFGTLGQTAEVARLYRILRTELRIVLDIEPSEQSRSIAARFGGL